MATPCQQPATFSTILPTGFCQLKIKHVPINQIPKQVSTLTHLKKQTGQNTSPVDHPCCQCQLDCLCYQHPETARKNQTGWSQSLGHPETERCCQTVPQSLLKAALLFVYPLQERMDSISHAGTGKQAHAHTEACKHAHAKLKNAISTQDKR